MSNNEHSPTLAEKSHEEFVSYLRDVGKDQLESGREFTAQDYFAAADRIEELAIDWPVRDTSATLVDDIRLGQVIAGERAVLAKLRRQGLIKD